VPAAIGRGKVEREKERERETIDRERGGERQ
jgi:hypothetical protein